MLDRPCLGFFVALAFLALVFGYGAFRSQGRPPGGAPNGSVAATLTIPSASGSLDAELAFQPIGHRAF